MKSEQNRCVLLYSLYRYRRIVTVPGFPHQPARGYASTIEDRLAAAQSRHKCEWITSRMWMSHVTYANELSHTFIGKVVFICLRVSVNLVYKFQGKAGTTTVKHDSNPNGLKFRPGSPWVSILSWLNLRQIKTTFPMHMWIGHAIHVNESHHACEWVMSRIKISHVTDVNESRDTCEWVMYHIWTSDVPHVSESLDTCEWVTSYKWISHYTHVNGSRHTCEWGMSRIWMCHVPHMNESHHGVTHVKESCPTNQWITSNIWMKHITRLNESGHTRGWVMSHIWMSHVTHVNEWIGHFLEDGRSQEELQNCLFTHPATNFITPQHTLHHTLFHIDLKRSFWPFYFRPKSLKSQQKSPISWQKSPISL